jgi:hypothetical protein
MSTPYAKSPDAPAADTAADSPVSDAGRPAPPDGAPAAVREIGGRAGPEPTRFGDWEKNGRCIDF